MTLDGLVTWWDRFFFEPIPLQALGCFRIAFGLVLLYEARALHANLADYLGPDGMVRHSSFVRQSHGRVFSLLFHLPPTLRSVRLVWTVHVVALVAMVVGLLTPLSVVVVYVTLRTIVNRNPPIGNGGDNLAKIMAFLLVFTAAGNIWSLDHVLFGRTLGFGSEYGIGPPLAMRLMQVQVSIVYLYTAYWKLGGATYRDGTALYYATANELYSRFPVPQVLLRRPVLRTLTWGTLALEASFGVGLWFTDIGPYVVAAAIVFHLVIEWLLNVDLFSWYMIAALLLFLSPEVIDAIVP